MAAKAAARLVSRQIAYEHSAEGCAPIPSKLPTDAAEAVLAGYYAVRKLGWIDAEAARKPPVQRYMNGAVVLPPAAAAASSAGGVAKKTKARAS